MTSFLSFHAAAAVRGDGLRPELLALLVRADSRSDLMPRPDGMIQSGSDPVSASERELPNSTFRGAAEPLVMDFGPACFARIRG
jgi:hypothetical protein